MVGEIGKNVGGVWIQGRQARDGGVMKVIWVMWFSSFKSTEYLEVAKIGFGLTSFVFLLCPV